MLHSGGLCFPNVLTHLPNPHLFASPISTSFHRPTHTTLHTVLAHNNQSEQLWLAQVPVEELTTVAPPVEEGGGGPIELPSSVSSIFATTDEPTTLQTATSLLLTGAISVFLFRSLRRRAKRAKELKFRSSGAKKSLKEEAMENLKAMKPTLNEAQAPPSPVQAFLGGLTAGVIALILYKFTTTIEAALSRQTISDNFSVRQITITIRTIINGLCYLATFVFGINSVGLFLYSGQLAINSFMGDSTSNETDNKTVAQSGMSEAKSGGLAESSGSKTGDENQRTDDTQL